MNKIEDVLTSLPLVSNVVITTSDEDVDNDGSTRGMLEVQGMHAYFEHRKSKAIDITSVMLMFEYTIFQKEKKERILEVINSFNKTKPAIKCCLQEMPKGKIKVLFKCEAITENDSYDLLFGVLKPSVPILSAAPLIFSIDMESKSIQHKKITREKNEQEK